MISYVIISYITLRGVSTDFLWVTDIHRSRCNLPMVPLCQYYTSDVEKPIVCPLTKEHAMPITPHNNGEPLLKRSSSYSHSFPNSYGIVLLLPRLRYLINEKH